MANLNRGGFEDGINPWRTSEDLCEFIRSDCVGRKARFSGPFGSRSVVYVDYAASGRALASVESYIRDEVLPLYGNTHSSVSVTSEQSTLFLHEARDALRHATNASEADAVVLCGGGCTSAVHVLIHGLSLTRPPLVVVGPHEHHSNLLPWRQLAQHLVDAPESDAGTVDLDQLQTILQDFATRRESDQLVIGCFSAASNATGIVADVDAITALLHKYDALAFWDYAAAAPYVRINMNPVDADCRKDAVYFSGHKFVGAVQSPGVLVAKKVLFRNDTPLKTGGGTITFVKPDGHTYLKDVEYREEGGTPDVVGAVRLALAFKLKQSVGHEYIAARHCSVVEYLYEQWRSIDSLTLLGPAAAAATHRLAIVSFVVRHSASALLLHHNFVCALLNDLFGVQCRAGCVCAGPYAQRLLGISPPLADRFDEMLGEDWRLDRHHLRRKAQYSDYEMLRPGFVRLSIPYFCSDSQLEFLARAVCFVAEHGWKLLPEYRLDAETGEWHHWERTVFRDRKWLGHVSFGVDGLRVSSASKSGVDAAVQPTDCFAVANDLIENAVERARRRTLGDGRNAFDVKAAELRWFLLSSEAREILLNNAPSVYPRLPFEPRVYKSGADGNASTVLRAAALQPPLHDCSSDDSDSDMDSAKSVEAPVAVLAVERDDWNRREVVLARPDDDCAPLDGGQRWHAPPSGLFKPVQSAIEQYAMLADGDRVLVCLSGGKDSLSLLHILRQYGFSAAKRGVRFQLAAVTVDPGSTAYDPSPLIDYLKQLNVTYLYERQRIIDKALSLEQCASICSFCSRMKRGRMYAAARKFGFNVLAFGQHLDDLAESCLIALFHQGSLRTMKACYTVGEGDLRVIRPLVNVREKQLRDFAESRRLPVIAENCPACFDEPKERHRVKQLLAAQELHLPRLFASIRSAIEPLLAVSLTGRDAALRRLDAHLASLPHQDQLDAPTHCL